uniref:F-box domain-containing protein n=2 Tax=Oryza brachyantha TaxID=4533 RepID=J3N2C2_ORYBR
MHIPDGVSEQVLLRLPVKSILRFRSVCRSWRATIDEPRFARLQLQLSKSRPPSMLIVPLHWAYPHERLASIMFIRYPGHGDVARLMHEGFSPSSGGFATWMRPWHCDGLVVAPGRSSGETVLVCNPATRELVRLPPGSPDLWDDFQKVGFGVDPLTGEHKVVRCFVRHGGGDEPPAPHSFGCEVFTLGSPAWRPAPDPPYAINAMLPLCLPGAIYWSASIPPTTQRMARFDLHDEEFTDFPPPPCMEVGGPCGYLTELGGKLCYTHSLGDGVQLWTAEDGHGVAAAAKPAPWSLLCTIKPWRPCWEILPFAAYGGGIFINVDFAVICRFDLGRQVLEKVVDMREEMKYVLAGAQGCPYYYQFSCPGWSQCVLPYSESMLPIGS